MKVELVAYSGNDLLVVNAARVSFAKESSWDYDIITEYRADDRVVEEYKFPVLKKKDEKLIKYLAEHKHWLPFRHAQITLRCKAPLFVARQVGKHQVGFSWSEESRRYIDDKPEFYWPEKWRKRADNIKQGSSEEEFNYGDDEWEGELMLDLSLIGSWYTDLINKGLAPEQARMILPQSMYINWIWTGSLLGWAQMVKQRTDSHTQLETQEFAKLVESVIAPLYPVSWEALKTNL